MACDSYPTDDIPLGPKRAFTFITGAFIGAPLLVTGVGYGFGSILAIAEDWTAHDGFLYVISNLLGLGNPLSNLSPSSDFGIWIDILVAVWSLSVASAFIGIVGNMQFIRNLAERWERYWIVAGLRANNVDEMMEGDVDGKITFEEFCSRLEDEMDNFQQALGVFGVLKQEPPSSPYPSERQAVQEHGSQPGLQPPLAPAGTTVALASPQSKITATSPTGVHGSQNMLIMTELQQVRQEAIRTQEAIAQLVLKMSQLEAKLPSNSEKSAAPGPHAHHMEEDEFGAGGYL